MKEIVINKEFLSEAGRDGMYYIIQETLDVSDADTLKITVPLIVEGDLRAINIIAENDLIVTGCLIASNVDVAGKLEIGCSVTASKLDVKSYLEVGCDIDIEDDITVNDAITCEGDLICEGFVKSNNFIRVGNYAEVRDLSADSITVLNGLKAYSTVSVKNDLTIFGMLECGSLRVDGAVYVK